MSRPRRFKTVFAIAVAIGLGLGASACNTVDGIGKDISAAGRALGADSGKQN
ncbi:MAG: entericidin [Alphaproteobacteria bacterium]|nr:entericidin [Alphaproteobacteria bacterium]